MAAECGVAAVVIVGVQPGGERLAAFDVAAVQAGVGPFVGQGSVKPFHFAVRLGPVRPGSAMFYSRKGAGEWVGSIASSVVCQHFSNSDTAFEEPGVGTCPKAGRGVFAFIGQQFAIGQPRVPVDGGMKKVITAHRLVVGIEDP